MVVEGSRELSTSLNAANLVPLSCQKTLPKSRFNYASINCAAQITSSSVNCTNAKAILNPNKDQYASFQTPNSHSSFLTVQLCQEIQIEQICLANYEFFVGTFEKFQLLVSNAPSHEWIPMGTFELQPTKQLQTFNLLHQASPFCKLIKLVFTPTQRPRNCLFTISTLQVYGKSMLEAYKETTVATLNLNKKLAISPSNPNVYSDLQQKMHILHLALQESVKRQNQDLYKRITRLEIILGAFALFMLLWFLIRKK